MTRCLRHGLILVGLGLSTPAVGAPNCEPLDEEAFRTLFLDALAAIDRDDADLHAQIVAEVRSRVPCLTFAPPPRLWADYLVGVAVVEFSRGGDWETPMAAALRIRPSVDRLVSGAHPINRWEPPVTGIAEGMPLPEGVTLWVDGARSDTLPPSDGLFLVQKEEDGWFETRIVQDEALGQDWVTAPVEHPPRLELWSYLSGGVGIGGVGQAAFYYSENPDFVEPAFSDYLPSDAWGGVMPRAIGEGLITYGKVGAYAHVELSWGNAARASTGNLHGGPIVALGPVVGMVGVGLQSFDVWEGGCHITRDNPGSPDPLSPPESAAECDTVATPRTEGVPFGYGGVWFRAEKPWRLQPRVLIGASPFMGRFEFQLAAEPKPTPRGARWRHALTMGASVANFGRQERNYEMVVNPYNAWFGLQTGFVFGRVR